jgi:hypothetical protein
MQKFFYFVRAEVVGGRGDSKKIAFNESQKKIEK